MRFAYADPPYPGLAARYYGRHPDFAGEVDHRRLVEQLATDYPDGWALSTDARSLPFVLSCLAGVDVSVAAWFRRVRPHATARRPLSAWEPVVYAGGRHVGGGPARRLDALICRGSTRTTDPDWVTGAKPAAFAYWVFDLLGALPGDELVDLFPGSGGIARAWAHYVSLDVGHDVSLAADYDGSAA